MELFEMRNQQTRGERSCRFDSNRPATSILCLALLTATLFAFALAAIEASQVLLIDAFRLMRGR